MYKAGDDVLFQVGTKEVAATVLFVDEDSILIEVHSDLVSGFKFSNVAGMFGENMTWAYPQELKPYKKPSSPILVYCSHAYGGKPANVADMTKRLRKMNKDYSIEISNREYVFVSPLNALPFYDLVDYEEGMRQCLSLLSKCQMMVTFGNGWEESKGVSREIDYCKLNNISIVSEEDFMKMLEGTN